MLKIARDLVQKISLFCSVESAIIDSLEDIQKEQYKIREDNKRCVAVNRSLEQRYTELTYAFRSVQKDLPDQFEARFRELENRLDELSNPVANG